MRAIRTVLSAVLILAGAALVALGLVSPAMVDAVEDGGAVRVLAARALEDPDAVAAIGSAIADGAIGAIADTGIDPGALGVDDALRALIASAARTEDFRDALLAQIDDARRQFVAELTREGRSPAPLVLDIDSSLYVNGQIDRIPVVGEAVPDVAVPTIAVEVLDERRFTWARTGYAVMETAEGWALWGGVALLAVGFAVTHRRRWYPAKATLAVAVATGALWLATRAWGLDVVMPDVSRRLATVAAATLVAAVAFALVAGATRPRRTAS